MPEVSKYPVVVSVGTDKHPFERLINWVDTWTAANPGVGVFVQHGTSSVPKHAAGAALIPHDDLLAMVRQATVVISHGGPSTVMGVRSNGLLPIVVGRNPAFGEHVDEHQMRFADHLGRHEMALCVSDEQSLHQQIDRALASPDSLRLRVDGDEVASGIKAFARHMNILLNIPMEAT